MPIENRTCGSIPICSCETALRNKLRKGIRFHTYLTTRMTLEYCTLFQTDDGGGSRIFKLEFKQMSIENRICGSIFPESFKSDCLWSRSFFFLSSSEVMTHNFMPLKSQSSRHKTQHTYTRTRCSFPPKIPSREVPFSWLSLASSFFSRPSSSCPQTSRRDLMNWTSGTTLPCEVAAPPFWGLPLSIGQLATMPTGT